jgi:hypothetical protein
MTIAGIEITDTDSLMAAADILDDVEQWVTCPECQGAKSIVDYSPDAGWINIECPACEGWGTVKDVEPDFDPEPPTPAAPALAVVVPLFRCDTCRDTGRVTKPSTLFPGKTIAGFCPDCTPHFDFASGRFVNCGATSNLPVKQAGTGEATPPTAAAPVPFDRAEHCRRIGQTGGLTTVARHGVAHMRAIGTAGARVTIERHGAAYWRGLVTAKAWDGTRRPDLLSDLAAGRVLADLDRAA